jgi:hypothetical protein
MIEAVATARDFVISNNSFTGNVSFVCPLLSFYFSLSSYCPSSSLLIGPTPFYSQLELES